jgi:hypothetical protein
VGASLSNDNKLEINEMKALKSFITLVSQLLVLIFVAFGCGGSDSGGGGSLSLELTDAMTNQFHAVYVTIDDVQVHKDGPGNGNNSWQSVGAPNLPKTFNLYDLTNGVRQEIGIADLAADSYTQMRLIIGTVPDDGINELIEAHPFANYVIDTDDNYQELKIPSGIQTGIKIVHGFTISANKTTELILDFNAEKSVVVAGSSGNWLLKPTIKVGSIEELSIIQGRVTSDGSTGIAGAMVSVQEFDGSATDDKDKVTVQTSTITDSEGYFAIFVSPLEDGHEYNLVIYEDGKVPEYRKIVSLAAEQTHTFADDDIQLGDASTKNVVGTVTITGGDTTEQFASISFRQGIDGDQMVEVTSMYVLNLEDYDIYLPVGSYTVVAWTLGFDTQTSGLNVADPEPIVEEINFPQS